MNQETKQEHKPLAAEELAELRCLIEGDRLCPDWHYNRRMLATIDAQSRLLDLAQEMAGAALPLNDYDFGDPRYDYPAEVQASEARAIMTALAAFTAARAEYQSTGTVPCGECEAKDARIEKQGELSVARERTILDLRTERDDLRSEIGQIRHTLAGWAEELTDEAVPIMGPDGWLERAHKRLTVPCGECEVRDAEPQLDPRWTIDVVQRLKATEAERDDLRRQLDVYKQAKAENDERFMLERDEARRQLAEAVKEANAFNDDALGWKIKASSLSRQLAEAQAANDTACTLLAKRNVEIEQAEADKAAMVEALDMCIEALQAQRHPEDLEGEHVTGAEIHAIVLRTKGRPGTHLLDLLHAFESLENAIKGEIPPDGYGFVSTTNALSDIDAIRNREGR